MVLTCFTSFSFINHGLCLYAQFFMYFHFSFNIDEALSINLQLLWKFMSGLKMKLIVSEGLEETEI